MSSLSKLLKSSFKKMSFQGENNCKQNTVVFIKQGQCLFIDVSFVVGVVVVVVVVFMTAF